MLSWAKPSSDQPVTPGWPAKVLQQRLDDARIDRRPSAGHGPDCVGKPAAFRDPVLEQVPVAGGALSQQRDRVFRIVALLQHDDTSAGVPLAHFLGGLDAFIAK